MAKIIANRYEIIKNIGSGGMADVYLALDTILNREVAIKLLKSDMSSDDVSLMRFKQEAHASTKISHPNIVDIYDVGDEGNCHYIVMEYVKGYTLKQLIKRRGAIGPREAVWMVKQLSGALMEAHKNGLIHRDVKSQNVLIKDDGTVKLADFGIAILNNSMQLTSKDSVLGSVHYLAPELAKGEAASMQSDIYSLGIVFYELLTGDVPFTGDTPVQVALKHIKEPLPDVRKFNPQIPDGVVQVLMKATAKNKEDRYENIAYMIKDLNNCLDTPVTSSSKNSNYSKANIQNAQKQIKNAKEKSVKPFRTLLILGISVLSIAAIAAIIVLTGVFSKEDTRFVDVPNIQGLTLASAKDAVDAAGLLIEYPVERILTESTEAGIVIGVEPIAGSPIEKGSKIHLIVSDGIYKVMQNYIGMNIDEAKQICTRLNITVKITSITDNDVEDGTITNQSGLKPNDQYDPNANNIVTFEVSYHEQRHIPTQILGRNVEVMYEYLSDEGFDVEKVEVDKKTLDEKTLEKYKANEVFKIDPQEGTLITKQEENVVTIYYYGE